VVREKGLLVVGRRWTKNHVQILSSEYSEINAMQWDQKFET
jgi:hypothetical protein